MDGCTSGFVRLTGFPMVFKNRYQLWAIQSLLMPMGIMSSSPRNVQMYLNFIVGWKNDLPIFNSGKLGPYMNVRTLEVKARFTLFHCSISATLCRQFMQHSLNVFHSGGEGKHWAQAISQIYKEITYTF